MCTLWAYTLWESLHRRMGLVLITVATTVCALELWLIRYEKVGGKLMVRGGRGSLLPPEGFANDYFGMSLSMTTSFLLFIGIFACAPLLSSFLEKGWAELVFAKGIARWQMLTARYLACLTLFATALMLLDIVPACVFWLRTGIKPWRFLGAIAFVFFTFAILAAIMAVVGVSTANSAVAILFAFVQLMLSSTLTPGRRALSAFFEWRAARAAIEWTYRILPKTSELDAMARTYWRSGQIETWWPVWSSALFILGVLALSHVVLARKDF